MANEKRMISLGEALKATHSEIYWTESQQAAVRSFLVKQPKVDAVEVVHGRNLKEDTPSLFECSVCGWSDWDTYTGDTSVYNYCPNCGAKMDGDGNGC